VACCCEERACRSRRVVRFRTRDVETVIEKIAACLRVEASAVTTGRMLRKSASGVF
jgi:hypothetical protein